MVIGSSTQLYANGLIDTGASVSLIDSNLLKQVTDGKDPHPQTFKVNGLGSKSTLGWWTLPVHLRSTSGKWLKFMVDVHIIDNLGPGIVLGNNFICGHQIQFDMAKSMLSFPQLNQSITCEVLIEPSRTPTAELIVKEETSIPPGASALVNCRWSKAIPRDQPATCVPALWVLKGQDVAICNPASILDAKKPKLFVTNLGTVPAKIPNNMPISKHMTDVHRKAMRTSTCFQTTLQEDPVDAEPFDHKDHSKLKVASDKFARVDGHFNVGLDDSGTPIQEIVDVIRRHQSAFTLDGEPGHVDYHPMPIQLEEGAVPRPEGPRRTSPAKKEIIDQTIDLLLDWNVIKPSSSKTSSPVLLVKQGPKWRFCVDYRGLNKLTVADRYPLKRIDDMLGSLGGSTIFSTLDAARGYHQLDIAEEDQWKTAFTCHRGLFEYTRIPFGLRNAPSWFQRFMDEFLGDLRGHGAEVYMDDVVAHAKDLLKHVKDLAKILQKAESIGLKFDPKKCYFGLSSLKLLGRLISAEGVSILPDRAELIRKLEVPVTLADLHHIIGVFDYYDKSSSRHAEKMEPLRAPLQKGKYVPSGKRNRPYFVTQDGARHDPHKFAIAWTPLMDRTFTDVKNKLADQATLVHVDFGKWFFAYLDSSQDFFAVAVHQQFLRPSKKAMAITPAKMDAGRIGSAQQADNTWATVYKRLKAGEPVASYRLNKGVLILSTEDLTCLPAELMQQALTQAHEGHPGFGRTYQKAAETWFHPRLADLCRSWVKHCPECIRTKLRSKVPGSMIVDDIEGVPFHTIAMDLMLGLPKDDKQPKDACLVIVDTFTKTTFLRPLTSKANALDIWAAVEDSVLRLGWQLSFIISDSDSKFVGKVGQQVANRIGAILRPSVPYHQQANPAERQIQTILNALKVQMLDLKHANWVQEVPALELNLNNTPNAVTGFSPYDLIFVHRPKLIETILEHDGVTRAEEKWAFSAAKLREAARRALEVRRKQKERFDARRANIPDLRVGDQVMVRTKDRPLAAAGRLTSKLNVPTDGPFEVAEVLSQHRYRLKLPDDLKAIDPVFTIDQLQVVPPTDEYGRPGLQPDLPGALSEPESILDERMFQNRYRQLLVKWKNSSRLTWEFEDDLVDEGATEVVNAWNEKVLDEMGTPPPRERASAHVADPIATLNTPLHSSAEEALDRPIHEPKLISIDGVQYEITERPIIFTSTKTSPSEAKLIGGDLESAGLYWSWRKLSYFFEGSRVVYITDHAPLGPIITGGSQHEYTPNMMKARTLLAPHLHNIKFCFRQGKLHRNVDALSRLKHGKEECSFADIDPG